ncbi:MAG: hypothetical protein ACYTBJ_24600 [Planctomycetota bacterium]
MKVIGQGIAYAALVAAAVTLTLTGHESGTVWVGVGIWTFLWII